VRERRKKEEEEGALPLLPRRSMGVLVQRVKTEVVPSPQLTPPHMSDLYRERRA